jgi:hypothetical protein
MLVCERRGEKQLYDIPYIYICMPKDGYEIKGFG